MPTPRAHGGAQLAHFPLNTPAFNGLNTQQSSSVLDPSWATRLNNTVIDSAGRIASRKGYNNLTTTTAATGEFLQLFEWDNNGSKELFGSTDDLKIFKSTDDAVTWTDVTGAATITDGNGQFSEFNGEVMYTQAGQVPLFAAGGANFADTVDGNAPSGAVSLSAFGRFWVVDSDGSTIRYSALLDSSDWTTSDSGQIGLQNVWMGYDVITGLSAFNGALVVFAQDNIVIYTDGQGSALGLDPLNMYVADTLGGIGCIARDSIQNVDGDLWFLSRKGVMSFRRLIQEKSNPLENLSVAVQDFVRDFVSISDGADIRAVYSQQERFYLLSLPAGTTGESGISIAFDTRGRLQDGSARVMGVWSFLVPRAVIQRDDRTVVMALYGKTGMVGVYEDYLDDTATYIMDYESGWTDMQIAEIKILKRMVGLLFSQVEQPVTFKWAFDFNDVFTSAVVTYPASAGGAEYGLMEFNVAQWGGQSTSMSEKRVGGRGTGEYIKLGFTTIVNEGAVAAQQLNLYAKMGRLK